LGSRLIAFVATAYLAAVIGPDAFGVLGFAFAVFTYFSVFVDAGFSDIGSKQVARNTHNAPELAWSLTVIRVGIAALAFSAVWVAAPLLGETPTDRAVLLLTCLLLFAAALDTAWVFKGLERGGPIAASLIIRRLAYALMVFLVIAGPADLLRVPVVQFGAELFGVLWLFRFLVRERPAGVDLAAGWRVLRSSAALMITKLLRTSVVTLDVVLLGLLATDRDVGLYSAAYRFCFFLIAGVAAVQVAYLPDVTRSVSRDTLRSAVGRHLEVSAALGVPLAIGGVILAGPMITTIFGEQYGDGASAFAVLLLSIGILFLFAPLHNALLAQGRLRVETWAMGLAAALNLSLNLYWIPRYGILGAAWATVAAEALILVWCGAALWKAMQGSLLRPLLRPAIASFVMAAVLLVAPRTSDSLLIGLPLGVVVYAVGLTISGGVPEDVRTSVRSWVADRGS
jgi:O-antigen/teichoic acid export membrane protein